MSEIKITDLVDEAEIDKLRELDRTMTDVLGTYTDVARELAKGVTVPVKGIEDLQRLESLLNEKTKEAADAQARLSQTMQQQQSVIANVEAALTRAASAQQKNTQAMQQHQGVVGATTNVISRELMEMERVNKTQREAYTDTEKFKVLLEQVNGSYENRVKRLVEVENELKNAKSREKELTKEFEAGKIAEDKYIEIMTELRQETRRLGQEKSDLVTHLKNEEKEMQSVEGSYRNQSQRLELMKKAYKDLTDEERSSPLGKQMEAAIQDLDAHLKDMAADMGEFQRNVGNYAIAGQNGIVTTESITNAMQQEATTIKDLTDQTKILEEGKNMLDQKDENYAETLDAVNRKIAENKQKLMDVSDILHKDATSVAEAEAQNVRLKEALKNVDLTSSDAEQTIKELNDRIRRNTELIDANRPAVEQDAKALKELEAQEKALDKQLKEQAKAREAETTANAGAADQMLTLVGINNRFASSLLSIGNASKANIFEGIATKVKALQAAMMGLLANPVVLTLLGIGGAIAGFKWWYDYNKGLEEATKQTINFTGETGEQMEAIRAQTTAVADQMGKDFTTTIGASNVLVQQFGLTFSEANELMKDGIQAGADYGGAMTENISKFAPAMRDAGISAEEFMAILANTRNGIFDEKAIDSISKAGIKLRNMNDKVKSSLDAIGISSTQMQKDLESGSITMLQAQQQIAEKLKELPPNCQEVGAVMQNVFGKKASEAGQLSIQSLTDIQTSISACKDETGEYGEAVREQMDAEEELHKTVAALFSMSGQGFSTMSAKVKTFVAKSLTAIVRELINIANWWIRLYNKSEVARKGIHLIGAAFKNMWEMAKLPFKLIYEACSSLGDAIMAAADLDFSGIKNAIQRGQATLAKTCYNTGKAIYDNVVQGWNDANNAKAVEEFKVSDLVSSLGGGNDNNDNDYKKPKPDNSAANKAKNQSKVKNDRKAAEKEAQEALRILQELEAAKLEAMDEGYDKEVAKIKQNYLKRIQAIKGNSDNEVALRLTLIDEMNDKLAAFELDWSENVAKTDLANRIALAKEGSEEEMIFKLAQLQKQKEAELRTAEEKGYDRTLIEQKFNAEVQKIREEFAAKQIEVIQQENADALTALNTNFAMQSAELAKQYAVRLKAAKNDAGKREAVEQEYSNAMEKLQSEYAIRTVEIEIEMMNRQLEVADLSAKERFRIEQELARKIAELKEKQADAEIITDNQTTDANRKSWEKKSDAVNKWLEVASDAFNNFNDLAQALFDRQVSRIEEEVDANTASYEKESADIDELVAKKIITEEEGEARKRAAEAETAAKNEELEKKKAKLQYKQAVWDKANSLAQTAISTAMAIMTTAAQLGFPAAIPFIAIAGATGALQAATIAATPIPKYKEGTEYHPGGLAVVGDGGQPEVVLNGSKGWITPATPTLVDLPRGAVVLPSLTDFTHSLAPAKKISDWNISSTIISNNSGVERKLDRVVYILQSQTNQQHKDAKAARYQQFKNRI